MDKPTFGKLRQMYKLTSKMNKALAWIPILRGRSYERSTLDTLRENNKNSMIAEVRAWLDEAEKTL